VVHRDVKPGNVLFDQDGRVHLTDFGIARLTDVTAITATGLVLGTAAYLAPEQVTGDGATPASDIYALGLVLLEALTGERVYDGSPSEAALARLHRQPEIPTTTTRSVGALLGAMTAADPRLRPSAAAVAAALTASGQEIPADATAVLAVASDATVAIATAIAPVATTHPRRELAGRLRVPLIAAAVVALLLIIGSAMSRDGIEVPAGATTPTSASPITAPPATAAQTVPSTTPPTHKGRKKGD
jgi:hypothetical protein